MMKSDWSKLRGRCLHTVKILIASQHGRACCNPAPGEGMQEDQRFSSISNRVRLRPAWAKERKEEIEVYFIFCVPGNLLQYFLEALSVLMFQRNVSLL